MEEYPEELRTPPIPLISLVGFPDLHAPISSHLHALQPPINTLALPDFHKSSLFSRSAPAPTSATVTALGFFKKDWLIKHRTQIPAVVAALFSSDYVSGDPAQWLQLCTHLDQLKGAIRARNIKLVVVIVQTVAEDDNEDRMIALRKRAELDSKYIFHFSIRDTSEMKQSLNRLGSIFAELINVYYREEGRRVKTRVEKRNFASSELGIRYCFKVAVYAEFRRDWIEALKFYEDAYHALREMVGTSTRLPAVQRLVEIKSLAEQLHFKIATLLLHGGKIVEAVLWFRQHYTSYRKLVGAAEVTFLHWEWVSRQFLAFAELLETSSKNVPGFGAIVLGITDKALTEWELQPAYYYQLAAQYMIEKKSCLEMTLSMWEVFNENDAAAADSVIPSGYVGQFARLLEHGHDEIGLQSLTDEEFIRYAIAEGKRYQDSFEIIALLKKPFEVYTSLNASRMASYCSFLMAREYFALSDTKNAKQYFGHAVSLYRHEGWGTLLWEILGYLRECSRRDGSLQEFAEYSLELAALPLSTGDSYLCKDCGPAGPPGIQEREIIQQEAMDLVAGKLEFASKDLENNRVTEGSPLHLEIDLVSPLRVVLLCSAAFHETLVKPGMPTKVTLSLLSQLPLPFEIDALDVQFNHPECNFSIQNAQKPPLAMTSASEASSRIETAPALALFTNKWLRLTYDVKSDKSGKLECVSVIARIGSHFSICCRAESPVSVGDVPLWKFEERLESLPTKDLALAYSGQKAIQIEEPEPQVDLTIDASGPALVGEKFIVPVTIFSKGHSVNYGELKINLVDTKGGGLVSPRDIDPNATESHHVELLGISGPDDGNPLKGLDKIRKIQHSFGLISVPLLKDEESWSCKLEITWHRPKPIMLFVSLSYSPQNDDPNAPKVHVHKSLEIDGKIPVSISHQILLPFRRDPLLLSRIKPLAETEKLPCLPLNETSILIINAKNCTELPLRILSVTIEADDNISGSSCTVSTASNHYTDGAEPNLLVPNEDYKKVFSVIPMTNISKVRFGTVCLRWTRYTGTLMQGDSGVLTKHKIPDANVELTPVIVCLECPPHAVLGEPFTYFIKLQNESDLLQEIKFSLSDSQSFVSSGSHKDTILVLPKSEHVLSYKLVPLASGSQQLPKATITSVRYSAAFQPSLPASSVFVFPTKPQIEMKTVEGKLESVIHALEKIKC